MCDSNEKGKMDQSKWKPLWMSSLASNQTVPIMIHIAINVPVWIDPKTILNVFFYLSRFILGEAACCKLQTPRRPPMAEHTYLFSWHAYFLHIVKCSLMFVVKEVCLELEFFQKPRLPCYRSPFYPLSSFLFRKGLVLKDKEIEVPDISLYKL